ncbi:MAG: response regulator transcription factor [Saprospiraceae bacterium]|nr:response regulator transcription factor [Saprospiraceae bacterium]
MKKIKILLADDHQIMLEGLKALLEKESEMEVVGMANSGEDALKLFDAELIDVAVLDISMPPGIDGIKTALQIRKKSPKTKTILLTMYGDGAFILNAFKRDIDGYVIKEKSTDTLITAIQTVLRGKRYFPLELLDRIDPNDLQRDKDDEEVQLSKRETEIICLMATETALNAREIADRLFIAKTTVDKHIQNIMEKLDLHKSKDLVKYAIEKKLCGRNTP